MTWYLSQVIKVSNKHLNTFSSWEFEKPFPQLDADSHLILFINVLSLFRNTCLNKTTLNTNAGILLAFVYLLPKQSQTNISNTSQFALAEDFIHKLFTIMSSTKLI